MATYKNFAEWAITHGWLNTVPIKKWCEANIAEWITPIGIVITCHVDNGDNLIDCMNSYYPIPE